MVLPVIIAPRVAADGTPFWTDNGVGICDITGDQVDPQLVGDGSGGAIITWRDTRSGNDDIYAQRVDASGSVLWTSNGIVICDTTGEQLDPQLVGDGSGGAVIAWEDSRNGLGDIYAQWVDAGGNPLWASNGVVICDATNTQENLQLVSDGSGGGIIAWEDGRSGTDIYAQRVDANGDTLWPADGVAICTAGLSQNKPQLVSDGSGGAVIVWEDHRFGGSDIYAKRIDADGNALWVGNGVVICDATNGQEDPQLVSDGSGGAIITWEDNRSSHWNIYAHRVSADGNPLWFYNGVAICDTTGNRFVPQLVGDGSGGAIIAWHDYRNGDADIYAQRVDASGNPLWTSNGVVICDTTDNQSGAQLVGDGSGGAIITWKDSRNGSADIYAQRVDASGNPLWTSNGVIICDIIGVELHPQLVGDGSGGAIITWEDPRSGNVDIYAQQVLDPEPRIAAIMDVPEDQGRQVAVLWDRSGPDQPFYQMITHYSIWRKYPEGPKMISLGEEWNGGFPKNRAQRVYRRIEREDGSGGTKTEYWELMGTMNANYFSGYTFISPTLYDSSAGGPAYFSFIVTANTEDPFIHWDSAPDSGYSVDNINPAKTQIGIMASGSSKGPVNTVWLSWGQVTTGDDGSPEQGPIDYRIYCDESPDFTPGPGNLLTTVSGLSYPHTDSRIGDPAANLFYLVTAVDGSDNESAISNRVGEFDRYLTDAK